MRTERTDGSPEKLRALLLFGRSAVYFGRLELEVGTGVGHLDLSAQQSLKVLRDTLSSGLRFETMNEVGAVRVPIWIAAVFGLMILVTLIMGDAKLTTEQGCQDWVVETAIEDIADGYLPRENYSFYGLGIGLCFIEE